MGVFLFLRLHSSVYSLNSYFFCGYGLVHQGRRVRGCPIDMFEVGSQWFLFSNGVLSLTCPNVVHGCFREGSMNFLGRYTNSGAFLRAPKVYSSGASYSGGCPSGVSNGCYYRVVGVFPRSCVRR